MGHADDARALAMFKTEAATGISWADAGKVELEQPQYLGFPLPGLSVASLTAIKCSRWVTSKSPARRSATKTSACTLAARSPRSATSPTPTPRRNSASRRLNSSTVAWQWWAFDHLHRSRGRPRRASVSERCELLNIEARDDSNPPKLARVDADRDAARVN